MKIKHSHALTRTLLVVLLFSAQVLCANAATQIDTTASDTGDFNSFGAANSATYGQTFTVTGTDNLLNSFSLYLRDRPFASGSGTLDLRGYIGTWNGSRASSILYESATQTMNADGTLQEFAFSPNLTLTSGQTYVAFLSISNLPAQSHSQFGMPHGTDTIPGSFVFLNNGTDFSQLTTQDWDTTMFGAQDVWFKADLEPSVAVPEPGTYAAALLVTASIVISSIRKSKRL